MTLSTNQACPLRRIWRPVVHSTSAWASSLAACCGKAPARSRPALGRRRGIGKAARVDAIVDDMQPPGLEAALQRPLAGRPAHREHRIQCGEHAADQQLIGGNIHDHVMAMADRRHRHRARQERLDEHAHPARRHRREQHRIHPPGPAKIEDSRQGEAVERHRLDHHAKPGGAQNQRIDLEVVSPLKRPPKDQFRRAACRRPSTRDGLGGNNEPRKAGARSNLSGKVAWLECQN